MKDKLWIIFGLISILLFITWANVNGNPYISDTSLVWLSGYLFIPCSLITLFLYAIKGIKPKS